MGMEWRRSYVQSSIDSDWRESAHLKQVFLLEASKLPSTPAEVEAGVLLRFDERSGEGCKTLPSSPARQGCPCVYIYATKACLRRQRG